MKAVFDAHSNKLNQMVNWEQPRVELGELTQIASIIGGRRLSVIMRNYAMDYKFWNHGMPDLILWNEETVKFSEVKSETDRLSEVQKAWLAFLSQNEVEVEVCYVNRDQQKGVEVFPQALVLNEK